MRTSIEDYLNTLEKEGFQEALRIPFIGREWNELKWQPKDETYFIYWRSPILVAFDTFGATVNGGFVWYNWSPYEKKEFYLENGYWENGLLIGQHDCRVDFAYTLDILENTGEFINPWVEHNLWLVNYVERYEDRDEEITKNRFALLPQNIKECIKNGINRKTPQDTEICSGTSDPKDTTEVRTCGC